MIITVSNNKGGNAKTTTITSFATILAMRGFRVLIVDTDPQGNASAVYGIDSDIYSTTLYEVLLESHPVRRAIVNVAENIDILLSNKRLDSFDVDMSEYGYKASDTDLLASKLSPLKKEYDYILVDTPSFMGMLFNNAMGTADSLVIPFVPDALSIKGVNKIIKQLNGSAQVAGIFPVMVETRTNVHKDLMAEMAIYCERNGLNYIDIPVKRSIKFSDAVAYGGRPLAETNSRIRDTFRNIFDNLEGVKIND